MIKKFKQSGKKDIMKSQTDNVDMMKHQLIHLLYYLLYQKKATRTQTTKNCQKIYQMIEALHGVKSNFDFGNIPDGNLIPLDQIYSARTEAAIRMAYVHDYRKFGFLDWNPKP